LADFNLYIPANALVFTVTLALSLHGELIPLARIDGGPAIEQIEHIYEQWKTSQQTEVLVCLCKRPV